MLCLRGFPLVFVVGIFYIPFPGVDCVSTDGTIKYTLINEELTWNEAAAICDKMNSSLLIVNEKSKLNHFRRLETLFAENNIQELWIGLYYNDFAFDWNECPQLELRQVVCDWYNWDFEKQQPAFPEVYKCVKMSAQTLMWRTESCGTRLPFLCEAPTDSSTGANYVTSLKGSRILGWDKTRSYTTDVIEETCLNRCVTETLRGMSCVVVDVKLDGGVCNLYFADDAASVEAHEVPDALYNLYYRLNMKVEVFQKPPNPVQEIRDSHPVYICSQSRNSSLVGSLITSTDFLSSSYVNTSTFDYTTEFVSTEAQKDPSTIIYADFTAKMLTGSMTKSSSVSIASYLDGPSSLVESAISINKTETDEGITFDVVSSTPEESVFVTSLVSATGNDRMSTITPNYVVKTCPLTRLGDTQTTGQQSVTITIQPTRQPFEPTPTLILNAEGDSETHTIANTALSSVTPSQNSNATVLFNHSSNKAPRAWINIRQGYLIVHNANVVPEGEGIPNVKILRVCRCVLRKWKLSDEDRTDFTSKSKLISKHNTTVAKRRKTSAPDDRVSVQTMGYSALIVIIGVWAFFVLLDVEFLYRAFLNRCCCSCHIHNSKTTNSKFSFSNI